MNRKEKIQKIVDVLDNWSELIQKHPTNINSVYISIAGQIVDSLDGVKGEQYELIPKKKIKRSKKFTPGITPGFEL